MHFLSRQFARRVIDVQQEVAFFSHVISVFVKSCYHGKLGCSETAATANKFRCRFDDVVPWCDSHTPTNEDHLTVLEGRDAPRSIGPVVSLNGHKLRAKVVVDFAKHGTFVGRRLLADNHRAGQELRQLDFKGERELPWRS